MIFGCIVLQAITWTCQLSYNESTLGFEPQAAGAGYPAQHWGCPANKGQGTHQAHETCSQRAKNVTAPPRVSPPCLHAGPDSPPGQLGATGRPSDITQWPLGIICPFGPQISWKSSSSGLLLLKTQANGLQEWSCVFSPSEVRTPNLYASCPLRYIYLLNLPNATTEFAISHITSLVSCIFFLINFLF